MHETNNQTQVDDAHAARVSMLGELTASIAHEVNQPLAAIQIGAEAALRWLKASQPDVEEARSSLRQLLGDVRRASDIVARIRCMASGRSPQRTIIDLHDVIDKALLFLRRELQSRTISVHVDLAPSLPAIVGDITQLQQVLVNLLMNAIQVLENEGTGRRAVGIRTLCRDSETVCCLIEDSGPGIDEGVLPQLFESFFTTKRTGMGLGLPIAKSIVESHQGRIHVDNNSSLGGARMVVELPCSNAGARRQASLTCGQKM